MSGEIGRDLTVAASREHEQLALFDLDEPSVVQTSSSWRSGIGGFGRSLPVLGRVKTCGRDGPEALLDVRHLTRNGSYCERHEPISWKERPSPLSLLGRRPDLRAQVRERERGQCVACGYHGDTGNPLEVHHVLTSPSSARRERRRRRCSSSAATDTRRSYERAAAAALTWLASARRRPFPALGGAPATTVRFVGSCARALIRHAADAPATSFSSTPEGRPRASERPRSVPGRCLHSQVTPEASQPLRRLRRVCVLLAAPVLASLTGVIPPRHPRLASASGCIAADCASSSSVTPGMGQRIISM